MLSAEINALVRHDGSSESWSVYVYGGWVIVGCQLHSGVLMSRVGVVIGGNYGHRFLDVHVCGSCFSEIKNLLLFVVVSRLFFLFLTHSCGLFVYVCVFQVNVWRVCRRRMWYSYTHVVSGPQ